MSKLNPQKATSYVGPGVLRKGGKITPVPNGPLVKKKGPFKGSTLKAGGKIKKAQNGESFTKDDEGYTYTKQVTKPEGKRTYQGKSIDQATAMKIANFKSRVTPSDSLRTVTPKMKKNGGPIKKAQNGKTWQSMSQPEKANKITELKQKGGIEGVKKYKDSISADGENRRNAAFKRNADIRGLTVDQLRKDNKKPDVQMQGLEIGKACKRGETKGSCSTGVSNKGESLKDTKRNGGPVKKAKAGAMIKRADGSMSKRGLWDNLRSKAAQNKKTGAKPKAPSKAMLTQEKKIKAKGK